jgi:16S rRNA (guanine966-N2)-methyltransferase
VKGALFSMIETFLVAERPGSPISAPPVEIGEPEVWEGLTILDLYAGTGALGIEALSRGAAWCDFVESDPRVRTVIERNLKATDLDSAARVIGADAARVVRGGVAGLHAPFGVVLLDPPYADQSVDSTMAALAQSQLLIPGALVALEHSRRVDVATHYRAGLPGDESSGLIEVRRRRHGDTEISIYRWRGRRGQGEGDDGDHRDLSG